jgi:two-component system chemotaxis sensor kinase CheA
VFLQSDGNRFGLVVDDVGDTQEIVIKPLSHQLRGISIFAGATIMGNGEVVLILDVGATARRAGLLRGSATEQFLNTADPRQEHAAERQELLLFTGPDDGRMAVPLSQVTRLEKFARSSLERARNQHVVQYRGDILPLTEIRDLLPERRLQPRSAGETRGDEDLHTIVYSKDGAQVGVIVGEIIDTVEHARIDVSPATRPGVLATAVIEGRVTEILDFEALCADLLASVVSKELSKA